MPVTICIICGTKTSKKWSIPTTYEHDFPACFGVSANEIESSLLNSTALRKLCTSCQSDISKFRRFGKTNLSKFGAKKGLQGKSGHKNIGGKRVPTPPEFFQNVSTSKQSASATNSTPTVTACSVGLNTDMGMNNLQSMENRVHELKQITNVSNDMMLNSEQESLFLKMTKHKLENAQQQTEQNTIYAHNRRGGPIKLKKVEHVRVNSNEASKRTIRKRAKAMEDMEKTISVRSQTQTSNDVITNAVLTQRAAQIKRDRTGYLEACKKANFKTHAKFTRKTVMEMRSLMPMTLFKKVKRLMCRELKTNVLGSESQLYTEMNELNFEYEGSTFIGDSKARETQKLVLCELLMSVQSSGKQSTTSTMTSSHFPTWIPTSYGYM